MPASDDRARRRAAIRLHHPDAGGSAEALAAALDALDRQALDGHRVDRVAPTLRGRLRRLVRRRRRPPRTLS